MTVGDRCRIGPRATLQRNVRLAEDVRIGDGSILGGDPQDLKYGGEETWVEVGQAPSSANIPRSIAAPRQPFKTRWAHVAFIMTYVHLAHDCHVGDDVVIAKPPSAPDTSPSTIGPSSAGSMRSISSSRSAPTPSSVAGHR